jgi:hypothetical protein
MHSSNFKIPQVRRFHLSQFVDTDSGFRIRISKKDWSHFEILPVFSRSVASVQDRHSKRDAWE